MRSVAVHLIQSARLLSLGGLFACTPRSPDPVEVYLAEAEAVGRWNGVALVAEHGKVVVERGTAANDSTGFPRYTATAAFPIASVSKTFTAMAILKLVKEGKLTIDAPVASILTGFPYPDVALRHLLSHTSGLPPYNAFLADALAAHPDTVFRNADILPAMIAHPAPLRYPPGTNGNYDNVNYLVLALIIEASAGVPYQRYIAEHILEPAGMRDTRPVPLVELQRDSAIAQPRLFPHLYSASTIASLSIPYVVSYWSAYRLEGFGDYVSTARDLLQWHEALASGRIVDTTLLKSAYEPVVLVNGKPNPGRFGLGWEVGADTGRFVVSHAGSSIGLGTAYVRDLTNDRVTIVFDNGHGSANEIAAHLARLREGATVATPRRDLTRHFGNLLLTAGRDSALSTFDRLHADTMHWATREDALNLLGYDLMGSPGTWQLPVEHHYPEAAAAFELNTRLYPRSWNVWDSYGEALVALGMRDSAVVMYRKALALNPGNASSTKALAQLVVVPK